MVTKTVEKRLFTSLSKFKQDFICPSFHRRRTYCNLLEFWTYYRNKWYSAKILFFRNTDIHCTYKQPSLSPPSQVLKQINTTTFRNPYFNKYVFLIFIKICNQILRSDFIKWSCSCCKIWSVMESGRSWRKAAVRAVIGKRLIRDQVGQISDPIARPQPIQIICQIEKTVTIGCVVNGIFEPWNIASKKFFPGRPIMVQAAGHQFLSW